MKRFIEVDNKNRENDFEYNKINVNLDNMFFQQEYDKKIDCLFNTMLENKQKKSRL